MIIENLSLPGVEPKNGDLILIRYDNGTTETKYFWEHPVSEQYTEALPKAPEIERIITKLEFVNKFTSMEFKSILSAAKSSPDIELWMMKFNLATYINLSDTQTIEGVQGLEYVGLIGQGRANEILS